MDIKQKLTVKKDGSAVDQPEQPETVLNTAIVQNMIAGAFEKEKPELLQRASAEAKLEIDKQMQLSQASFITVFGIFASITSFLTIEFQFLKTLKNVQHITGFTLILFAALFGFNIALDYLVKSRLDRETPRPNMFFSCFVTCLFVIGILLMLRNN
jgi:hypothetical protein